MDRLLLVILSLIIPTIFGELTADIRDLALIVTPGAKNCQSSCNQVKLDCFNDRVNLNSLDDIFVREWFYMVGWFDKCVDQNNTRSDSDQPAIALFDNFMHKCFGWKKGSVIPLCNQTTTIPAQARTLCLCGNLTNQETSMTAEGWITDGKSKHFRAVTTNHTYSDGQSIIRENFTDKHVVLKREDIRLGGRNKKLKLQRMRDI